MTEFNSQETQHISHNLDIQAHNITHYLNSVPLSVVPSKDQQ